MEGDQTVDDVWNNPLLRQTEQQVCAEKDLQCPSHQEELADPVSFREVQFVAESGGAHEVGEVLQVQVVRPVNDVPVWAQIFLIINNFFGLLNVHHRLHPLLPEEVPDATHLRVEDEPSPIDCPAPVVHLNVGDELQDYDGVAPAGEDGGEDGAVHGVDDQDGEDQGDAEVEAVNPACCGPEENCVGQEDLQEESVDHRDEGEAEEVDDWPLPAGALRGVAVENLQPGAGADPDSVLE